MTAGMLSPFRRPGPSARILLALLLVALWGTALGAEIDARVSRPAISLNDSFELVFEAKGSPDAEPDFTPLDQDFDVLSRQQSQNIQMTNGDFSRRTIWSLTLMAKRAGHLEIPAIAFGRDRSKPLAIEVRKDAKTGSGTGQELFLEVEAEPKSPFVQAQVVYTVRLLVADSLPRVNVRRLTEPRAEGVEVVAQQIGEDTQYRTSRDGRSYRVLERRYALFPQRSGTLRLQPILFEGEVLSQGRNMDPLGMFNSQFFDRGQRQVRRLRSQALELEVQPAPPAAEVRPWLPARHLQLAETWSDDARKIEVGQTLTRTLTLIADGLTAAQLPPLLERAALPDGLKGYPDQPALKDQASGQGVTGTRQEKMAIIATGPGAYTLPGLRIDWWSTETRHKETATTPPRRIQVVAAPGTAAAPPPPQPSPTAGETRAASEPSSGSAPATEPALKPSPATAPAVFAWLSLFLGLGWLATLAAWWRSRHRTRIRSTPAEPRLQVDRTAQRQALARLRRAYEAKSSQAAQQALLDWGRATWPRDPPLSVGELGLRCDGRARPAIEALSRACYGRETGDWNRMPLWSLLDAEGPGADGGVPEPDPQAPLARLNP